MSPFTAMRVTALAVVLVHSPSARAFETQPVSDQANVIDSGGFRRPRRRAGTESATGAERILGCTVRAVAPRDAWYEAGETVPQDRIEAQARYILASSPTAEHGQNGIFAQSRDALARRLTPPQQKLAQQRAQGQGQARATRRDF